MRKIYRGHEINVRRERSLGGDMLLYISIFRIHDDYCCEDTFSTGDDTIPEMMRYMQERIDAELASDDPWLESEDL